jgi:glutathione S-transferase|tara:strand:- start:218 stop:397 length:180 start_codon:yes stop_codon:yes gene_type:complete
LHEKDLDWVDHRLDSRNDDNLPPEYLELNPNGMVPTANLKSQLVTSILLLMPPRPTPIS